MLTQVSGVSNSMLMVPPQYQERGVSWLHGRGWQELRVCHFPWARPWVSLPLPVTKPWQTSGQCLLGVLLVHYKTWGWFGEPPPPNLQLMSEVRMVSGIESSNLRLSLTSSRYPPEMRATRQASWRRQDWERAGRKPTPLSPAMARRHPESRASPSSSFISETRVWVSCAV